MTLTPSTIRQDLKCGKGAISEGEKCNKGLSTRSIASKEKSAKAQRVVKALTMGAGITGAALLGVWAVSALKAERANRRLYQAQRRAQEARIQNIEQNQRSVAATNRANPSSDFMRGFGASAPAPMRPTPTQRPWAPPTGSEEAKVQAAFTRTSFYHTTPNTDPNPDVSAAWARVKQSKPHKPYPGDPDVSGVWANGFRP